VRGKPRELSQHQDGRRLQAGDRHQRANPVRLRYGCSSRVSSDEPCSTLREQAVRGRDQRIDPTGGSGLAERRTLDAQHGDGGLAGAGPGRHLCLSPTKVLVAEEGASSPPTTTSSPSDVGSAGASGTR
jgi:hypothetical protein